MLIETMPASWPAGLLLEQAGAQSRFNSRLQQHFAHAHAHHQFVTIIKTPHVMKISIIKIERKPPSKLASAICTHNHPVHTSHDCVQVAVPVSMTVTGAEMTRNTEAHAQLWP